VTEADIATVPAADTPDHKAMLAANHVLLPRSQRAGGKIDPHTVIRIWSKFSRAWARNRSEINNIRNSCPPKDLLRRIVARIQNAGGRTKDSVRKRLDTVFHEYANDWRALLSCGLPSLCQD
jgi:hypothetical protein